MREAVLLNNKIETLKKLETYGYQVAYYILQDERLAIEATKIALMKLSKDDEFCEKSLPAQRDTMKKIMIKVSIKVKQKSLTAST